MNTFCRYYFFIFSIFILTGCGSLLHLGVKQEQINTERYPNPQEFLKNQKTKPGITEPELLKLLRNGHEQQLTQISKAEDVQKILFGNITPQAHKEDLADISSWILSHHIFVLPYKNVRTEFFFEPVPISYNITEFGPDMNILFITKKDESDLASPYIFTRAIISGTEHIKTNTKEYIWEGLFNAVKGAAKLLF